MFHFFLKEPIKRGVDPPRRESFFSGIIYHYFFVAFLRALKWAALGGGEMGRETESRRGAVKERGGKKISRGRDRRKRRRRKSLRGTS